MRDLSFEVLEEGQQQLKAPPIQTVTTVKEEAMECFIHDCKLEKVTSQTGWEYVKCPMSDCFIFTGLDKVNHYLENAQQQIPVWYRWNKEKLKCFCSEPLVLCESRSEQNPNRMYFKCQRNRCKFFQWGDNIPSGKNMSWLQGIKQVGSEPPGAKYYTLPEKENPRPLLSVTGQDPLWDVVLNTPLRVDERTNEILSPQALKGFSDTPGIREELLQYLYLSWKLNAQANVFPPLELKHMFRDTGGFKPDPRTEVNESVDYSAHPRKVKLHQEAAARGLTG